MFSLHISPKLVHRVFMIFCALMLVLDHSNCIEQDITQKNIFQIKGSVTITSLIEGILQVHCHSANNDLGVQTLSLNQVYGFHFNENIWGTTLFTCDFSTPSKNTIGFVVWEGWFYRHPFVVCIDCNWVVGFRGFLVNHDHFKPWPDA